MAMLACQRVQVFTNPQGQQVNMDCDLAVLRLEVLAAQLG